MAYADDVTGLAGNGAVLREKMTTFKQRHLNGLVNDLLEKSSHAELIEQATSMSIPRIVNSPMFGAGATLDLFNPANVVLLAVKIIEYDLVGEVID